MRCTLDCLFPSQSHSILMLCVLYRGIASLVRWFAPLLYALLGALGTSYGVGLSRGDGD